MQSEYIPAGFSEIHGPIGQVESAELVVEDADNSDNDGEREIIALVAKNRETGDDLATVQLTEAGARRLFAVLNDRLSQTFV
jgi:hypothetical protein